jgi:quinol monooxygenase YgiN
VSLTHGVLALLTAKPGREADLAAFLEGGRDIAAAEPGTRTWYAFQVDGSTYGIFDTFEDEAARQAHLTGQIPAALGEVADVLLASAPDIRLIDLVAVKDPA